MSSSLKINSLSEVLNHLTQDESAELANVVSDWIPDPVLISIRLDDPDWESGAVNRTALDWPWKQRLASTPEHDNKVAKELITEYLEEFTDESTSDMMFAIGPIYRHDHYKLNAMNDMIPDLEPFADFDITGHYHGYILINDVEGFHMLRILVKHMKLTK